jgi:hypothetical protein
MQFIKWLMVDSKNSILIGVVVFFSDLAYAKMPPFLASLSALFLFYSNEVIQKARSLLIGASGDVLGCRPHFL